MRDESPSRELENITRERYWPMILGFAAVALAVVSVVLLIAHRLATSGDPNAFASPTKLVVVTGTPQATFTPYPTYTPYPKTPQPGAMPYPTYTPLTAQATPTPSPILTLGQLTIGMPYNGDFENCGQGAWPNPITLRNTGTTATQWSATLPRHYTLTPMQSGSLTAGASSTLTINGPAFTETTFTITFSAGGARQNLTIPCVNGAG